MLSWRDIKNPLSGGAERVTFELLSRFASSGHSVTWFASSVKNFPTIEKINGVKIVRKGSALSVYYQAYKFLKGKKYDLVIDQVNTIPFFTPLYYSGKKIAFFHQLCEKIWFYEKSFFIALIGFLSEKVYLRFYSKMPTMVVSNSTKENLRKYGFNRIFTFRNCIDTKPLVKVPSKEKNRVIYVGRLKKSKRVEDVIHSHSLVKRETPTAKLDIVGRGDSSYEIYLKNLVKELSLEDSVTFHGFLDSEKRNSLMKKAEAIVVTSVKEGWGLIVVEANAMGTPAIVYNVDGLRDSVISGYNGLITRKNNPESLAKTVVSFLKSSKLKQKLSERALLYANTFDWDEEFEKVEEFVGGVVR